MNDYTKSVRDRLVFHPSGHFINPNEEMRLVLAEGKNGKLLTELAEAVSHLPPVAVDVYDVETNGQTALAFWAVNPQNVQARYTEQVVQVTYLVETYQTKERASLNATLTEVGEIISGERKRALQAEYDKAAAHAAELKALLDEA